MKLLESSVGGSVVEYLVHLFFSRSRGKRGDGCGKTEIITGYEDLFDQLMQGHVRLKECPDALEKFTSLD
jgi:hypothetical protein